MPNCMPDTRLITHTHPHTFTHSHSLSHTQVISFLYKLRFGLEAFFFVVSFFLSNISGFLRERFQKFLVKFFRVSIPSGFYAPPNTSCPISFALLQKTRDLFRLFPGILWYS